jgi:thioredoxin reductase (NADPH)
VLDEVDFMSTRALSADAATPSELEVPYSSPEYRQHQMFPRLSCAEIQSLRRFARPMSFKAGELIFERGHVALGLFVLLHGRVRICSGKPALIDGVALTDIETLVIEPDRLRALIVADAQLGEHIMRALILRRLGLIEQGLGPIIVGNGDDARLVGLQGFLRRNAYPAMVIDARSDPEAITLLGGMTTGPDDFPLVFCPNGYVLRAPDEAQLASYLGLVPTFEPLHVYEVAIVGAGPAGLAASVYAATEGLSVAVFDRASTQYPLETSVPGMFGVGDVRSESVKRVAVAVVSQIRAYLSQLTTTSAQDV